VRVEQCRIRFRPYSHVRGGRRSRVVDARECQTERCHLSVLVECAAARDSEDNYLDNRACETMKDLYVAALYGFGCGVRNG
jgi:hypothetical protein